MRQIEMWTFWGIRKITKAYKILAKYNMNFTVINCGEEWLNKKCYIKANVHINTDTTAIGYKQMIKELSECKN